MILKRNIDMCKDQLPIAPEYIDSLTYERGTPTPIDRRGMTKYVAGEMCETLNDNWGDADDIKDPKTFYLFKYNLGMGGDTNVALDGGAAGIVEFDGFEETAESVRWLDDGVDLNFEQNGTNIKIGCNNFRYGKSHCVRVAEIKIK